MNKRISLIIKFLPWIKPFLTLLIIVFISDISLTLITMLPPLFFVAIFDYAYPNKDISIFNFFIIAGLLIYFINIFLSASIDHINNYVDRQVEYGLSKRLFSKMMRHPYKFHVKRKVGDLTVKLTDDIYQVVDFMTGFLAVLLTNLAKLGFFLFIVFKMDFRVTILFLCSIPLYIIETKFFSDKLEDITVKIQEAEGNLLDSIQEKLLNIRTIQAFSQEDKETKSFGNRVLARFRILVKERLVSIMSVLANSVTLKVWGVFIAWYLGYSVIKGYLSIGELIALTMYLAMIEEPITELSELYSNSKLSMVSMERINGILSMKEDVIEDRGIDLREPKGEIKFDNVSFEYEPKLKLLSGVNIDVPKNTSIAVVGASGSGKSTLVNLLMRFYPIKEGAIYIDGKNILEIKLKSLRKVIGAVFQEISIFEGTVRDNILYGSCDKTEDDIINAAKAAQAHNFISRLPGGYDFCVKPQGINLSGGQKQRIALARIFLYDPKIVIMDEATSGIDPESEFLVQEAIYRWIGKKTLFIIAHKLSTIKKVDKIIVLDKGRIVEEGNFDNLLQKQGLFFKLYNYQFGGFEIFEKQFNIEFQRFIRYKGDISVIIMEADNFETMSKKYPFEKLLTIMNELNLFVKRHLRTIDYSTVFQDEYILVALPGTGAEGAKNFCNRINKLLETKTFEIDGEKETISLTMGLVSCKEMRAQTVREPFIMATKGLLEAKKKGLKIGVYG